MLLRWIIVGLRGMLLKCCVKIKINLVLFFSVIDNLLELGKINKFVYYNVVSCLVKEVIIDNKLEVGMICDGYLMRIDNLILNNFFNFRYEDIFIKIKLNVLRE